MLNYLRPDTRGGNFVTQPTTQRVAWPAPFDEVLPTGQPRAVPLVRIPLTAGTWLYDIDADDILSAGYRYIIDLLVQNLTSQGIAVALDMHASCGGSKINCTRSGPMALRNFGAYPGALAFWANVSATYGEGAREGRRQARVSSARPASRPDPSHPPPRTSPRGPPRPRRSL